MKKENILNLVLMVIVGVLVVVSTVQAATTISTNIVTEGTLSVTGTTTLMGNVGVGTSSPTALLHLQKDQIGYTSVKVQNNLLNANSFASFSAVSGDSKTLDMGLTTSLYSGFGVIGSSTAYYFSDAQGGYGFMAYDTNASIRFAAGGQNEQMRLSPAGKLGIGTVAPTTTLDVRSGVGAFQASENNVATVRSNSNLRFAGFNLGYYDFNGTADDFGTIQTGARINSQTEGSGNINTWQSVPSANLIFLTTPTSTTTPTTLSITERMRITGGGSVGIGTSTPVGKLHISNGAAATTTVTIGELGLSSSKGCVNMNASDGSASSFYINAAHVLVVEANYCR